MDVPITVGEALRGASIDVPTPGGTIKVKVPAGAQSGQQLRIKGKGVAAHGQTPAGDLYLRLMIRVPKEKLAQETIAKTITPEYLQFKLYDSQNAKFVLLPDKLSMPLLLNPNLDQPRKLSSSSEDHQPR